MNKNFKKIIKELLKILSKADDVAGLLSWSSAFKLMATGQWQPLFAKILLTIIGVLCDIVLTFKTFAEVKIIKDKPVIIKPDSDPGNIHRERRRAEYQRQFVESKKAWLSKFSTPEKIESYLKSIRK